MQAQFKIVHEVSAPHFTPQSKYLLEIAQEAFAQVLPVIKFQVFQFMNSVSILNFSTGIRQQHRNLHRCGSRLS